MPGLIDISEATGEALDKIGRTHGLIRRTGESDSSFYGRVRGAMGIVAPSFEDIDYQVRLAIDVAHDMLPLVAKASDVQGLALALAGLPVPTLKIIKKIQDKYRDPEGGKPSGKALNRFQILKDGL